MREQQPVTQTMNISTVRAGLNMLVNQVSRNETRVVVEKSGVPVAALVSTGDLKRLDWVDDQDREARDIVAAMRAPFRDVPPEEFEREADRVAADARAERRARRERTAAGT